MLRQDTVSGLAGPPSMQMPDSPCVTLNPTSHTPASNGAGSKPTPPSKLIIDEDAMPLRRDLKRVYQYGNNRNRLQLPHSTSEAALTKSPILQSMLRENSEARYSCSMQEEQCSESLQLSGTFHASPENSFMGNSISNNENHCRLSDSDEHLFQSSFCPQDSLLSQPCSQSIQSRAPAIVDTDQRLDQSLCGSQPIAMHPHAPQHQSVIQFGGTGEGPFEGTGFDQQQGGGQQEVLPYFPSEGEVSGDRMGDASSTRQATGGTQTISFYGAQPQSAQQTSFGRSAATARREYYFEPSSGWNQESAMSKAWVPDSPHVPEKMDVASQWQPEHTHQTFSKAKPPHTPVFQAGLQFRTSCPYSQPDVVVQPSPKPHFGYHPGSVSQQAPELVSQHFQHSHETSGPTYSSYVHVRDRAPFQHSPVHSPDAQHSLYSCEKSMLTSNDQPVTFEAQRYPDLVPHSSAGGSEANFQQYASSGQGPPQYCSSQQSEVQVTRLSLHRAPDQAAVSQSLSSLDYKNYPILDSHNTPDEKESPLVNFSRMLYPE